MIAVNITTPLTPQEVHFQQTVENCSKIRLLFASEKKEDGPKRTLKNESEFDDTWKPKKRSRLTSDQQLIWGSSSKDSEDLEDGEIMDDESEPTSSTSTNCSVIVRGMDLDEEKLRRVFKQNANLICGKITVDSKQKNATIHFRSQADVDKAVTKMNGYMLNGITIKVVVDRSSERVMQHTSITINTTQKKPKEEKAKAEKKDTSKEP